MKLSNELFNELTRLNNRKLEKGEVFLLAKAIEESLPLSDQSVVNFKQFIIAQKRFIDEVIFEFNKFSYLDVSERSFIETMLVQLAMWRSHVAYGSSSLMFVGSPNRVIDDISLLPKFVDISAMCSVADILDNANYMYRLFKKLVAEVKLNTQTKDSSGS